MILNSQSLSKEQVLIVGCGDIGERFAKALPADAYKVTGLRRTPPQNTAYLHYVSCDATNASQLKKVIDGGKFDVILVSMTPGERSDAGYERAYVQTCKNLVTALEAHQHKPRLLLFISSTAVYGQQDNSVLDEDSPALPDSFSGVRLQQAEQCLQDSGFACVIARFSGIYGPGRTRMIDLVRQGRASLSPHITNRIHADDGAAALVHLTELSRKGVALDEIYIVTDSAPAPMAEVSRWLAAQMQIADFADTAGVAERGNKSCSNKRLLATGFKLYYSDYKAGYSALLAEKYPQLREPHQ